MLAVPSQHAPSPFLAADQGGIEWGGPVPLTVGVDFAAPLLVHVGRVEWVKVSRYMYSNLQLSL